MPDPNEDNLPGDAEEVEQETEAEGDGEEENLHGLKSALSRLKTERTQLKDELAKMKAENAFMASIPKGLKNPRAARVLAAEFDLIMEDGALDVTAFKKQFPEFLPSAPGNAGEGTTTPAPSGVTPNEWIRRKAGRK